MASGMFGGFSASAGNILHGVTTGLFWFFVVAIIACILIFSILWSKKQARYGNPVIVCRDFGNGKAGFNVTKAGKFHRKKFFMGLFEKGGEFAVETKDGRYRHDGHQWKEGLSLLSEAR
jgi:hypothetical protein